MKAANILETIGNTPDIRINRLFGDRAEVWMKSRAREPRRLDQGSHRAGDDRGRRALAASSSPAARSSSRPPATPASAWRWSRRSRATRSILVMPDSMSVERRRLMLAYGAKFELTAKEKGMQGAVDRARGAGRADAGQLDAAAVRQSRQRRSPPPHDRAGNSARFRRYAARCDHHRRRHRRPHHRLRRGAEAGLAEPQGVRGRAGAGAVAQRRQAGAAPDPGPWRQLHPEHSQHRHPRRNHRRRRRAMRRKWRAAPLARKGC